ncbi:nucleotidyl transferase AbiEii/AbiGii toxin family protein [Croceibacterium ferulae]|uniref:nucleotidyl transferase AbiEii/AbiGii toxin family protein n=1 Tax=Croceibacterium ferulae TaxID=1854641 RepID=UPI001588046C|nr:nucleotidyl transferase AbiEii/AbiGii toxin family protein [Croceibacterium ferulae]
MLQIDHRESHDIDLFLDDPQVMPFLNPETQDYSLDRNPDGYEEDGGRVLKLTFADIGEIDFICCASITAHPANQTSVRGRNVLLETPAEIVAKKIYYRGSRLQPRDMFDLAAVVEREGERYVVAALRQCGSERCEAALQGVDKMSPDLAAGIIGQLMFREHHAPLLHKAQSVTQAVLRASLAGFQLRTGM